MIQLLDSIYRVGGSELFRRCTKALLTLCFAAIFRWLIPFAKRFLILATSSVLRFWPRCFKRLLSLCLSSLAAESTTGPNLSMLSPTAGNQAWQVIS